jgi:hypothetical protein
MTDPRIEQVFAPLLDINAKLWRYMSFTKYVWSCFGKGVYSARIAFLSTATPRRGIPRP